MYKEIERILQCNNTELTKLSVSFWSLTNKPNQVGHVSFDFDWEGPSF